MWKWTDKGDNPYNRKPGGMHGSEEKRKRKREKREKDKDHETMKEMRGEKEPMLTESALYSSKRMIEERNM